MIIKNINKRLIFNTLPKMITNAQHWYPSLVQAIFIHRQGCMAAKFQVQRQVALQENAHGEGRREVEPDTGVSAQARRDSKAHVIVQQITCHKPRSGEYAVGDITLRQTPMPQYHVMEETEPDARDGCLERCNAVNVRIYSERIETPARPDGICIHPETLGRMDTPPVDVPLPRRTCRQAQWKQYQGH